jgi:tRNA(Ile2)-agmatinylcytidine synthase
MVDLDRIAMLDSDPNTFMSRDLRSNSILISPRGNCPVLFGVRAKTEAAAEKACQYLLDSETTESVKGYMVFQTNQATDDHLGADSSAIVNHIVVKQRGTVKVSCNDNLDLMAFAESGDIKNLAQWLKEGDKIEYNGLVSMDKTIHLERLRVLSSEPEKVRPKCNECNVTLKSMGRNQDLRCPKCKKRSPSRWQEVNRIPLFSDWVQPPSDSMRHLSKPIDWK